MSKNHRNMDQGFYTLNTKAFESARRVGELAANSKYLTELEHIAEATRRMEEHLRQIELELYAVILHTFELYGYSEDWLREHIDRVCISEMVAVPEITVKIFSVDDRALFKTVTTTETKFNKDWTSGTVEPIHKIVHIATPPGVREE